MNTRARFFRAAGTIGAVAMWPQVGYTQSQITLRYSSPNVMSNPQNVMMVKLAQDVEKKTNGRVKIEIYPNGQLAKEQASIDGLQSGTIDMTLQTTAYLEPLFPHVQAIDIPFIFRNRANAEKLLDGDIGQQLFEEMKPRGIQGIVWGTSGWRDFYNSARPVKTAADMKGLRFRIQNGKVYVSMMQALGAIPIVIDISEVYVAMSQHTVDGMEGPLSTANEQKHYEVTKYLSISNHIYNPIPLLMSKTRYDALGPDIQKTIVGSAKSLQRWWRDYRVVKDDEGLKALKDHGMVANDIDYATFRKAMDPVWADYREKIGADFFDKVAKIGTA